MNRSNYSNTRERICFFAPVDDPKKLEHIGFYRQDIDSLSELGYEVIIATKWSEIPWGCDYYFIWWWTWAFKPLLKAKLSRKPSIITGTFNLRWGDGDYYHRSLIQRLALRASLWLADHNMFVSHHELDPISAMGWVRSASYSPHCVDTSIYAPDTTSAHSPNRLLSIGWMHRENAVRKGMPDIIRAMPRILEQYPDTELLLVGDPDNGKEWLEGLASELGISESVHFLGKVDEGTKIELLQTCTIYVQPSRYEGFGLAILEAMSCGALVVTRQVGAVPEVVDDTGLYAGDGVDSLADCVLSALDAPQTADELRLAARKRAIEIFPLTRRTKDIARELSRLKRSHP